MKKDDPTQLNSADLEVLGALTEFRDALKNGERIDKKFTVRTVHLDLKPRDYGPGDVQQIRKSFRLSQAVFGVLLGASVKTVRGWEQGTKKPSSIASRFMDEMARNPAYWRGRIREMSDAKGGKVVPS